MQSFLGPMERGHEAQFATQKELVFKVFTRRDQVFATWAARLMGRRGSDVTAYVDEVFFHVFGERDTRRLVEKVHADLNDAGLRVSEDRLRDKLYQIEGRACRDVLDVIVGHPIVPQRREPVVEEDAAKRVPAIEIALDRVRRELAVTKTKQLSDLFDVFIHPGNTLPAE